MHMDMYTDSMRYAIKGEDFTSEDIAKLAEQHSLQYEANTPLDARDMGLFHSLASMHPSKPGIEKDRLSFMIAGHRCEMYFICRTVSSSRKNESDTYDLTLTFSIDLAQPVADVYVETRVVPTLGSLLGFSRTSGGSGYKRVALEGDFNEFFRVSTRDKDGLSAFQALAPNMMIDLLQKAKNYDIEFTGQRVYIYRPTGATVTHNDTIRTGASFAEYKAFLQFGATHAQKLVRTSLPARTAAPTTLTENVTRYNKVMIKAFVFIIALLVLGTIFPFIMPFMLISDDPRSGTLGMMILVFIAPAVIALGMGVRWRGMKKRASRLMSRYGDEVDGSSVIKIKKR